MEFRSNPICNHRARIGSYTFLSTMYKLFYTMYDKAWGWHYCLTWS